MAEHLADYSIDPVRARFKSKETEHAYREYTHLDDSLLYAIGASAFCIPGILFSRIDYMLFGFDGQFWALAAARLIGVAVFLTSIPLMYRVKELGRRDAVVALIIFMASTLVIYVNWTRPSDYTLFVAFDIVVALAYFVFFRVPLWIQLALAFIFLSADLGVIYFSKDVANPLGIYTLVLTFALVIALGTLTSWQHHMKSREHFAAWRQVKTLKGFLPICANCNKVRDDDGYWTRVAEYIEGQTDAKVTHGVCPDCQKELYPELYG